MHSLDTLFSKEEEYLLMAESKGMFHIYLFYGQFFYATCTLFFIRTIFPQSGSGFGLGFALELGLRAIFVVDNFPRTVHEVCMNSVFYSQFS